MIHTPCCLRRMVTSPHHLASQAGLDILKRGGTAVEAGVAVAATLAVVYPHMTGIGGDGFWLIAEPDGRTHAIDACGAAAAANLSLYEGHAAVPWRGPLAANTVAGTVSGWEAALAGDDGQLPLATLLSDAIHHADAGVPVTAGRRDVRSCKGRRVTSPAGRLGGWAAGRLGGGIRAFAPAASRSIRSTPLARFDGGRVLAYGAMGGDGQPQTQAAIFSRYARFAVPLQEAITRPRWLLGKTWGEDSTSLKLENRFDPALAAAGHDVQIMEPFTSAMAHDGAIVRHGTGLLEGATDPRSDGMVATW